MLSVIIPTYNSAKTLKATLDPFRDVDFVGEVIISDGGSNDQTSDIAAQYGARWCQEAKGRGPQLAAGGRAARGEWLLFLHSDTVLQQGWADQVQAFMAQSADKAGYFSFALDDDSPMAQRVERAVARRCRWFALPYGDQGLLISRALYDQLGGYHPLPLMEDVDLVRRIGRGRLQALPLKAVTSAIRYRKEGYYRRVLRNALCLSLYFCGVSPERILKIYR